MIDQVAGGGIVRHVFLFTYFHRKIETYEAESRIA